MIQVYRRRSKVWIANGFHAKNAIKTVAGHNWDTDAAQWSIPASAVSVAMLDAAFAKAGYEWAMDEDVATLLRRGAEMRRAMTIKHAEELPDIPMSRSAWLHQRRAFHWMVNGDLAGTMLNIDMGGGKSGVSVAYETQIEARSTLILAPKNVVGVWPHEYKINLHPDAPQRDIIVPPSKATVAKRAAFVAEGVARANARRRPYVVVVNHDAAWRPAMAKILLALGPWDVVKIDESHRGKAPGGKFSMFTARLRDKSQRRLCLTGTMMPHGPLDVYAQYRFLDPGIFGTSFNRFKKRYAVTLEKENRSTGKTYEQIVDYQNEDELAERIALIGFSHKIERDGIVHAFRPFQLSPKSLRAYKAVEEAMCIEIGETGGQVTITNALTRLLRLAQICSGYLRDDEGQDHLVSTDKIDLLADVLEDFRTDEPIVVFARFQHDLEQIRELAAKQGRRYGEISGRKNVPPGLTEYSKMRPDIDLVGVQLQAGGVGIDLTRSHYGIYYNVDYSLGNYDQTIARLDRPGQEHPVEFIHLVAEGTVDVDIYDALNARREIVDAVTERVKQYGRI